MAKTNTNSGDAAESQIPAGNAPVIPQVTLDEFCMRLSASVRRPELINGFYSVEKKAGRIKDHESTFRARFDAFVNKPV